MPYTLELLDIPPVPAPQGKLINADGTPTTEYVTFLRGLEAWMERVRAALDELEP